MRVVRGVALLLLLLPLMSGCHVFRSASAKACHGAQPYQKAQSVPQIPAASMTHSIGRSDTPDWLARRKPSNWCGIGWLRYARLKPA